MQRDYIRFSGKTLEAEGRCALPAFYCVIALRIFVLLIVAFGTATWGPNAVRPIVDLFLGAG